MTCEDGALTITACHQVTVNNTTGYATERPRGRRISNKIPQRVTGDGIDGNSTTVSQTLSRYDNTTTISCGLYPYLSWWARKQAIGLRAAQSCNKVITRNSRVTRIAATNDVMIVVGITTRRLR